MVKIFLFLFALSVSCQSKNLQWWQTASFYQIYPRSFKDSNGDGVGDLKGIREKLPYLKEIGITAAWLSPIFTSPMIDFGYDISNLTDIDPIFGTMADFEDLVVTAKKIGLKIILDFVPNHTSDLCEWFKKSAANDPYYKDFYVWHPGKIVNGVRRPPTNWISVFRGSMWEWNEQRQAYYLHQFHAKQPDLNFRNPTVVETMKDVLRFWLRKGAFGFRIDSVPHNFEVAADSEGNYPDEPRNPFSYDPEDYEYNRHIYTKDQPETVDLVYQFRRVLDEMKAELGKIDDFVLMTESYTSVDVNMQFYGNSTHEGAQIPFNFDFITSLNAHSNAYDYEKLIYNWLNNMPKGRTANWVVGNHDNKRVGSRLGVDRIDIINILVLTLPGISITYQGEEIGMTDVWLSWEETVDPQACQSNRRNYERLTRDPARTPFQWNSNNFSDFTNGSSTWLPVSSNYKTVNVMRERGIARSHLNIYKRVQNLRTEPTFQEGSFLARALSEGVLAMQRSLRNHPSYFVLLNLGDNMEEFDLSKEFSGISDQLECVVVTDKSPRQQGSIISSYYVSLMPKEAFILKTLP